MSYQGPMLIKEPELRWPLIFLAAIITTCIALVTAGALKLSLTKPAASPAPQPRLEGALRPQMPEFDWLREKIIVEQLTATEVPRLLNNDYALEMIATVRNTTGHTLNGLEMRGALLDARKSIVRERTVVVIPTSQTALEPGEAIAVRILLEGVRPDAERAGLKMEVTALRID